MEVATGFEGRSECDSKFDLELEHHESWDSTLGLIDQSVILDGGELRVR